MTISRALARPLSRPLKRNLYSSTASFTPAFSLFSGATLSPLVTFTRASSATYIDSAGVMQTAATNAPRIDYDPETLAFKGLLVEEARTNLFLNSLSDGTNLVTQNVNTTAQAYTISFYGTGSITLTGTHAATINGGGAYPTRTTLTFTPTAGTLTCTVAGNVKYSNCEAGAFATSYIPTTAATATRAADLASVTGASFSGFYNQSEGAFVVEGDTSGHTPSYGATLINGDTSATSFIYSEGGNTSVSSYLGTPVANLAKTNIGSSWASGIKAALSYSATGRSLTLDGAAVATDARFPVTTTVLHIGKKNATAQINGHIKSLNYYNTRLPDATLVELTT